MPHLSTTRDHRIDIPMPWKRMAYAINWDEMRRGRPVLVIAWYCEFSCFFLRIGWTHWWDNA